MKTLQQLLAIAADKNFRGTVVLEIPAKDGALCTMKTHITTFVDPD